MAFPASPSNNQIVTVNNISYIYSSASNSWTRTTSGNIVIGNGAVASSSTTTGALVVSGGAGISGNLWSGNLNTTTAIATNFVGTHTGTAAITSGSITGANGAFTTLTATNFSSANITGTFNGTVATSNVSLYDSVTLTTTNQTYYLQLTDRSSTGNASAFVSPGISYNASSNVLSTTANISAGGWILPTANASYNLGSTTAWWGTLYGLSTQAKYADLAENYTSDNLYEPGTVVVFGGNNEITVSTSNHDSAVAGVISTNPAYLMNAECNGLPVAFTGRVPCKVKGPVNKGTVLVTSDVSGVAMAIDNSKFVPGCIIGKALESIDTYNIKTIEVVVGRH